MPGLIAFNRRWGIGSDDFVFPALIEFGIRVLWCIPILVILLKHKDPLSCVAGQHLLQIYLTVLLVGLSFIILIDILIAVVSSRGTITQTRPRQHLAKLVYLRLFLTAAEILWNAFGTKWAFTQADRSCEPEDVIIVIQIVVICSWILIATLFFGIFLVFDPIGTHSQPVATHRVGDVEQEPRALYINLNTVGIEKSKKVWEWRMRVFCCFHGSVNTEGKNAYSDIAKLFSEYFEDIDLVPSDIAAGLILLRQRQVKEMAARASTSRQSENISVQSPDSLTSTGAIQGSVLSSPGVFTPVGQQFWMTGEMAVHFMKFAQGSYGWPMFLYSDGLTGFCKLWREIKYCSCCCKPPSYIDDDNCCHCHTAALKRVTGLTDEDLIYVSFHNRIYEVPFYVAVDHQTCSIIVAIRGTLSLSDALTDLTAESEPLSLDTGPQSVHCHRGMLRAAQFVRQKLDESHALSDAFALHQSYSLVVTGHSLGAGTAALLAVLLRPVYPNLRCFAFAPPGGLLSQEGAKHTEDFVFSIVLADDIVPRLSFSNMEDMKKRLLSCILDCDQPKYKIFLKQLSSCFGNVPECPKSETGRSPVSRPLLEHLGQNNSSGNYTTNSSQEGSSEGSVSSSHAAIQPRKLSHIPLHLPGHVLHITQVDSSFRAHWVSAELFNQIIISPRMVSDHMPHFIYSALQKLVSNSGGFIP